MRIGNGDLQYELVEGWEQLPAGWSHPDVPGVATDSQGRVYLVCRGDHPVIVYDRSGKCLGSWGEGQFTLRTHGIFIGKNDDLFLVDDANHTVQKFTLEGKLLLTIGTPRTPSNSGYDGKSLDSITHGGPPFNRPTHVAVAPNGDLYASDGYGNARVHRFSADGQLIQSWGSPGTGPGQFHLPHNLAVHRDGRVFVADRESDRVQIFSPGGEYLAEWTNVQRPSGIYIDANDRVYVGELVWRKGMKSYRIGTYADEQPARVSIYDIEGNLLLRWGGPDAAAPGNFVAPHGIWVDDEGSIYLGEVTKTIGVSQGYVPDGTHTLQKFARVK
ncbi:MAG: hypothetical protein IT307_08710 [Chloroflexi bacterium]|nr:hypothetical protein [Chloroflexota bacterium]